MKAHENRTLLINRKAEKLTDMMIEMTERQYSINGECPQCLKTMRQLQDPVCVHVSTLRGLIAKMSDRNVKHIYPHLFTEK